ncbi:gamma-glutamyltransferase family protein [Propionibacteriaceae bacterium Y1685]
MAFTTRPTLRGTFGMVSSTHWLATAAAQSVLERGGNAFDAAVTAGFALHVVEPHLNGPGGDAPILASVRGGAPQVLCGQGPAPAGATVTHYRDLGLDLVPGTGPLAAALPGAVDAWLLLLRDHGTWPLGDVLAYAIELAQVGHVPVPQLTATVEAVRDLFTEHWSTSARLWLPGGRAPRTDELFCNPALAATWRRLVAEAEAAGHDREAQIEAARRTWREGFIAEAMLAASDTMTMDSSGTAHRGTMTGDDLAGHAAHWEEPVSAGWGDWTVHKVGPWSQGPVLLQQLTMLDDVTPGSLAPQGFDAEVVHRLVEQTKLAFADRDAWYGDAAEVPLETLLSAEYAAQRRGLVSPSASYEWRPGSPSGRRAVLADHIRRLLDGAAGPVAAAGVGEPTVQTGDGGAVRPDGVTRGDTCHVDVVDRWGNLVAATPSGGWLQSNPTIAELGFPLGSRLQMAWLTEGLPNTLTPGRRPRTTLTPSMASRDGQVVLAFGTPGGDQQDQWSTHLFLRLADEHARTGRLELQAAIDATNWHTDAVIGSFWPRSYDPGSLVIEGGAEHELIKGLKDRGHNVTVGAPWSEGRLCAVSRDPESGILSAGANPRGMQGYAAGR